MRKAPAVTPQPRWLTWLEALSVLSAVVVLFGVWPIWGGDFWMHLTVGQWIVAHGWVPTVDHFTYTNADGPFLAHSWLAEVIFYLVAWHIGTPGLMVLRFVLISLALMCSLCTARSLKAPWPAVMLLVPFVLGVIWAREEFRPHLFTTTMLAGELWLLVSIHTGQRSWRWLWVLPPLCAVSINLHGGWVQVVLMLAAITGAVAVMTARQRWRGRETSAQLPLRQLTMVLGACLLALFMNPYGPQLVAFPLRMQASWIRALIFEWQSPWGNPGWRVVGGGQYFPIQPVFFLYVAWLIGVLLVAVRRWRTGDLVPVAIMGLWAGLALWHLRTAADTVLLTSPFVAASCRSPSWQTRRWAVYLGICGLIPFVALAIWVEAQVPAWRWDSTRPRCVEALVKRLGQPVRVLGTLHTMILLFDLPHLVKIAHTGWEYNIGATLTTELDTVWKHPATVQAHVDRYHVNMILLPHTAISHTSLLHALGFTLAHIDERFVVMLKRTPETETFLQREMASPRLPCRDEAPFTVSRRGDGIIVSAPAILRGPATH